jgi:hypothetical protein
MGILSQIENSHSPEKISVAVNPPTAIENFSSASPPDFCPICTGTIFWQSVYNDGIWRCGFCEQPPTMTLAKTWRIDVLTLAEDRARRGGLTNPGEVDLVVMQEPAEDLKKIRNIHSEKICCCGSHEMIEVRSKNSLGPIVRVDCAGCRRIVSLSMPAGEPVLTPPAASPTVPATNRWLT